MSDAMDPALPSPFHLWSPHPFGAYSTTCASGSKNAESGERAGPVEETAPPAESAECPRTGDDRVLLDTWYVIKPGNTKEKVAFFVAYQCAGSGSCPRPGGAKVKGRWSAGGSSRAKRRRHAVDPEAPPSVAEMVARAENRGAEAAAPRPPLVLVTSSEDGDGAESRCRSVAEAVAQYEAEQAEREVRIAFRVAERPGDPITCDLYQLLSPEPHRVCVLLEKMESQQEEDSEEAQGAAAESGFHVDLVLTGAVDRCVFYGGEADETEPLPGQLFFPRLSAAPPPPPPPPPPVPPLCRLYRHVSHDFLEIRFQVQRLLQPRLYLPSLPDHVLLAIFSYLSTQSLAAMKCTCRRFRAVIEDYGVRPCDSRWSQHPLYRDDPCKQCKRIYKRGDVSMCRWHPKPYHHDLPYGRSYWMCCRRPDRAAPGCQLGLHDNNWVLPGEGTRVKGRGHGRGDEGR